MLLKCCTQYVRKFGKLISGHRTGKVSFIPIPKKGNAKECSNYHITALISHASKVMLKILQARLQQYMNREFRDIKGGLRKGRGTQGQTVNIPWVIGKKKGIPEKHLLCFIDYPKVFVCITTNCRKFWKRLEYQTTLTVSWDTCMWVKEQQLELDMEQFTGSKLGKEYDKAIYCHFTHLTYMQSTSYKMSEWITSWNQDCREKYQQPQICRWYHSNGRKWRGTKETLDEGERWQWKCWLEPQHWKKLRSWYLAPSLHGK